MSTRRRRRSYFFTSGGSVGGVLFRDDATAADNTLLQSRATTWGGGAGIGSGWTRIGTVDARIQTNRIYGGVGSDAKYRVTDALGVDNHTATWVLRRISTSIMSMELWVRMSSDGQGGYVLGWDQSANSWYVRRRVAGASQLVTGSPANVADTWTTGTDKTADVTINGSNFLCKINGVTIFDVTDTTVATGQYIGFVSSAGAASGVHYDSVTVS